MEYEGTGYVIPADDAYQLRSEETGMSYAKTLREALRMTEEDETIWKLSFLSESEDHIRLVRMGNTNEWKLERLQSS
jgi:hypothetical protein